MPSGRFGTLAARIVINESDAEKFQSLQWPDYCFLREWVFKFPEAVKRLEKADQNVNSDVQTTPEWRSTDHNKIKKQQNHTHGSATNGFKITHNYINHLPNKSNLSPLARIFVPKQHSTKSVNIGHLNINRLLHLIHHVRALIVNKSIHIFAITETWLTQNILDGEEAVEGFRLFRRDRSTGHQGGGVCFYVHLTFNVKRLYHLEHPALEMLWLEITISKEKVKICFLYRPPSSSIEFWSTLEKASEEVQGHRYIVLMGDLNVDALNKGDPHFRHLKSLQLSLQLHNVIQSPTRLTVSSAKCLDVILSNHSAFSDGYVEHLPLLIMLWCTPSQIPRSYLIIWVLASSLEGTGRSLTIRKNNWKTSFFVLLRNGKLLGSTKCGRNGKLSFCQLLIRLPR